ncbi:MAG: hypothetical protein RI907_3984 [Pseudomonadota bacterium]|jgi:Na+/melibiose symporter-like transporter
MPAPSPPVAAYGLLGLPLAFGALPLYVALPHHYAQLDGVSLPALGAALLGARALDAVVDPALGRAADRLLRHHERQAWWVAVALSLALVASYAALWRPAPGWTPLTWLWLTLTPCTLAFSALGVLHQAWGTRWGGTPLWRARVAAWREGLGLVGVVLASALMGLPDSGGVAAALALGLVLGLGTLRLTFRPMVPTAPHPEHLAPAPAHMAQMAPMPPMPPTPSPWAAPAFRRLAAVYLLNGLAAAVPATLLPFFVTDALRQPAWQPAFLLAYFGAAALTLPWWLRTVARRGLGPTWRLGMGASVSAFMVTPWLGAGDGLAFLAVCLASGAALGADLAAPGALLTGLAQRGDAGAHAGWWALLGKLSLALAAGLSLPLLQAAGYGPGQPAGQAVWALTLTYAALPCALKLLAAATLSRAMTHHPEWRQHA